MRRAFITPILHVTQRNATNISRRRDRINRRLSTGRSRMSLLPLEEFETTRFPQSVEIATGLLKSVPETLTTGHKERLNALLKTSDGTRGLFVALLSTEEIRLAETPLHDGLREIFIACGADTFSREEIVVLAVKNVTMSSAMMATYRERGEMELAEGSEMTRRRAINVLKTLDAGVVARDMVRGLRTAKGRFEGFGRKWGYGEAEVRNAVEGLREACGDDVLV